MVVAIYTERCNMARALKDTDSIVRSLELSLGAVIHFLFCAIYLTIWCVKRRLFDQCTACVTRALAADRFGLDVLRHPWPLLLWAALAENAGQLCSPHA